MTVPYLFVLAKAIAPCLIFPNQDTKSEFSYLDSESIEATGRTDSAWVGHLELDVQLEEALVVLVRQRHGGELPRLVLQPAVWSVEGG